jgi:ubiquinone biosynthesis protein UbiJ
MRQVLENALNRYLALDSESKRRIRLLQDKRVMLELLGTPFIVQLIFNDEKIILQWDDFSEADIRIKGTPLNLLHMSLVRDDRHRFFADDVIVEGNMELAQNVLAIFDELEIDWEEQLSQWVGDVPAYQTGRFVRGIKKFNQRVRRTFLRNLNEYVHEEINLFPTDEALQLFFDEVDELRMDVDRLEARLLKIKEKIVPGTRTTK